MHEMLQPLVQENHERRATYAVDRVKRTQLAAGAARAESV
jgi:hypothetical protein